MGKVMMPITTKGVTTYSTLMVVNADSVYNAILGHPLLHDMKYMCASVQFDQFFATRIELKQTYGQNQTESTIIGLVW